MLKKLRCFVLCLAVLVVMPMLAWAAEGYTYDIAPFEVLAAYAGRIGCGLRHSGLFIGAFGLTAMTVFAIFGKVNWKTLWYILLSLFILSFMAALVGAITNKSGMEESRVAKYCNDKNVSSFSATSDINKIKPITETPAETKK